MNWPNRQAPENRIASPSLLAAAIVAAGFVLSAFPAAAHDPGKPPAKLWNDAAGAPAISRVAMPDFVELAARLSPSVVNIAVEQDAAAVADQDYGGVPDAPGGDGGNTPAQGLGSGFVINKAGYILTNNHVVADARKINVTTRDGHRYAARLVGADPRTDVALIKIDPSGPLPAAPLGDSRDLPVGAWVMAIGNPFGFDHSVTVGIVSAKGRFIPGSYDQFIQTDASINPGNSGGPLIDGSGRVIGVTSAIYARTGSNTGISFAIPIDLVKEELPDLAGGRRVVRGWLGVYIEAVTPEAADAHGLSQRRGAMIDRVLEGGPAQKAGLKNGDLVVSFDGHQIAESQELPLMVGDSPIGHNAVLGVIRGRRALVVRVKIEAAPDSQTASAASIPNPAERFGLVVEPAAPSKDGGVRIDSVAPDSPADASGLRVDDIILEVNRDSVSDSGSFEKALESGGNGDALLLVRRGKATVFISISPAG